jgi:glycine betaine catabolism A
MTSAAAPLDPHAVGAVLTEDYGAARTLPSAAYTADAVLDWEREHVFDAGWVCVGRSDLIAEPKAQTAASVGRGSIVLARGEDGVARGFANFCRHRGHMLLGVGECAKRSTIACPYHSWAFNLDGTLRTATRFSDIPGFDKADFPLQGVAVEEWGGWIWVNASGEAGPLSDWLGNLDAYVGDWQLEGLRLARSHEYVVESNWKLILENYLECYHCPSIHPELCRVSPPESAEALPHAGRWLGGPMELRDFAETMSLDGGSDGVRIPGLTDEQARQVSYFAIFPSLLLSPHPDYVMTHRMTPVSPTATAVECAWYFPPEAIEAEGFDPSYATDFWDLTNRQDFSACEGVQSGMASPGFLPGPFDYRESGVYALQAMIASGYLTGTFERPPAVDLDSRQPTLADAHG